jgi:hypothetical protein
MANSRFGLRTRPGIIRSYSEAATGFDAESIAFASSAGITNDEQIGAIDFLVKQLKEKGLWDKIYTIYPIIGGSATSHKFNLKSPLDTDAAYRLNFTGGWTHAATGMTANGTTAYADTFLNISSSVSNFATDHHMAMYLRTQQPSAGDGWHIGVGDTSSGNPLYGLAIRRFASNQNDRIYDMGNISGNGRISDTTLDAMGFYIGSKTASNAQALYRNGSSILSSTSSVTGTASNGTIHIGSMNPTAGSRLYLQGEFAMISIGQGLNSTQAQDLSNIAHAYNSLLNRQV